MVKEIDDLLDKLNRLNYQIGKAAKHKKRMENLLLGSVLLNFGFIVFIAVLLMNRPKKEKTEYPQRDKPSEMPFDRDYRNPHEPYGNDPK